MKRNRKAKWGFTLIELLIVVAIIAILAAIAVPNFLEAQMRAKIVSVKADMKNIVNAQELYRADYGDYVPDSGGNWDADYNALFPLSTPVAYIVKVPTNPFFDKDAIDIGTKGHGNFSYWRDWDAEMRKTGVGYAITSVGPNGRFDMSPEPNAVKNRTINFVNTLYNPTNGTKSYGDLHACALGVSE